MKSNRTLKQNRNQHSTRKNAMNTNIVNNVIFKLAAVAFAAMFVNSAAAQDYTGNTGGPIAITAFSEFQSYPSVNSAPQNLVTLETFRSWQGQVLNRQNEYQANVGRWVNDVDRRVYERYVQSERALWRYRYTGAQEEVRAYNAAQNEMQQLKAQRREVLNNFYNDYVNVLVEMHKNDPNRDSNYQWYTHWINQYRNAQAQANAQ